MTFDPTTNRVQWCLLTDEEQAALKAWPHGWKLHNGFWYSDDNPSWRSRIVYQGKPAPVVTSVWQNIYVCEVGHTKYKSRRVADENAPQGRIAVLRRDTVNGVTTAHLEDV